jgi:hypothetical protein
MKAMLGKANKGGAQCGPGVIWRTRDYASVLQVLLKPAITYGEGENKEIPIQ